MRTGDRKQNLLKAVYRYQNALRIFTAFGITHLIKKVRQEQNNALNAQKGSQRKW
jgi:hypothetical protein